jgi:hypothetical protein
MTAIAAQPSFRDKMASAYVGFVEEARHSPIGWVLLGMSGWVVVPTVATVKAVDAVGEMITKRRERMATAAEAVQVRQPTPEEKKLERKIAREFEPEPVTDFDAQVKQPPKPVVAASREEREMAQIKKFCAIVRAGGGGKSMEQMQRELLPLLKNMNDKTVIALLTLGTLDPNNLEKVQAKTWTAFHRWRDEKASIADLPDMKKIMSGQFREELARNLVTGQVPSALKAVSSITVNGIIGPRTYNAIKQNIEAQRSVEKAVETGVKLRTFGQ